MINPEKIERARNILKLETVDAEGVKLAYRTMSKVCHPDSGAYDAGLWEQINWAKGELEKHLAREAPAPAHGVPCKACSGQGRYRPSPTSKLTVFCVLCNGTGNREGA